MALFIRNVGVIFRDRDLILGIEPSSQVHEFAALGAEGIGAIGLVARVGVDRALADGAGRVRNFGLGGHGVNLSEIVEFGSGDEYDINQKWLRRPLPGRLFSG